MCSVGLCEKNYGVHSASKPQTKEFFFLRKYIKYKNLGENLFFLYQVIKKKQVQSSQSFPQSLYLKLVLYIYEFEL